LTFRVFISGVPFQLPADDAIVSPQPFRDKSLITNYRATRQFCYGAGRWVCGALARVVGRASA
jgi:hypothetical protein